MCNLPLEVEQIVWKMLHTEELDQVHQEYEKKFKCFWSSQLQFFLDSASDMAIANYRPLTARFSPWSNYGIHKFNPVSATTLHWPVGVLPASYIYSLG